MKYVLGIIEAFIFYYGAISFAKDFIYNSGTVVFSFILLMLFIRMICAEMEKDFK